MEENDLPFATVDPNKGIVVGWETKLVEEDVQIDITWLYVHGTSRSDVLTIWP